MLPAAIFDPVVAVLGTVTLTLNGITSAKKNKKLSILGPLYLPPSGVKDYLLLTTELIV